MGHGFQGDTHQKHRFRGVRKHLTTPPIYYIGILKGQVVRKIFLMPSHVAVKTKHLTPPNPITK